MFIMPYHPMFAVAATSSYVRVLHASPDAPPVDIYANDILLAQNVKYKDFTKYYSVQPGKYNIKVYPTGTKDNPVLTKNIQVPPNTIITAAAINLVKDLDLLPVIDEKVPFLPGTTMIRFVHLSPDAPAVDITLPDGTKLFDDVKYKQIENYIPIKPGNYTLQARVAGTDNIVLTVPNIRLYPNRYYTVYAVGLAKGDPPLQVLIPLDGQSYL